MLNIRLPSDFLLSTDFDMAGMILLELLISYPPYQAVNIPYIIMSYGIKEEEKYETLDSEKEIILILNRNH
ncbi:hypothetical protein D3C77_283000 [compost metagenome]